MRLIFVNQWRNSEELSFIECGVHNCGHCAALYLIIFGIGVGLSIYYGEE